MSAAFYRAFEDRHRGPRALIKARLAAYLPFLAPLAATPVPAALDLGCGRGEWLELLGEHGFRARGVDLDEAMLAACRERGLAVARADAVASLRAAPDASLALVSGFHLAEHLPFGQLQVLIGEALRALAPGGLLILETPNPENLVVGACNFYLDPTHQRPLPPPLLDFALEFAGFARRKVLRLQEAPGLRGDGPLGLSEVLGGASPDYALVGQKDAPAALLARFDPPFAASYGIALEQLALRYGQQMAQRLAEIHRHLAGAAREDGALHGLLGQLAGRLEQTDARLERTDGRLERTGAQLERTGVQLERTGVQLDRRLAALEARADGAERRLLAIESSYLWRLTAPLRAAQRGLRRLRAAHRDGRLGSGLRRRLKGPLRRLLQAGLRQARLKRALQDLLHPFPALRGRLRRLAYAAAPEAGAPAPARQPDDLSPRAARVFEQLSAALKARED